MRQITGAVALALILTSALMGVCEGETNVDLFPKPNDLAEGVPPGFPRFYFKGNDEAAQLMGRYCWYHFSNRLGNGKTLFNKEYLTTADLWAAGAIDTKRGSRPIQEIHREDLSAIKMDAEGYVFTHQHFSHAHEHGWPFPIWMQAETGPDKVAGKAVGWHFQDNGPGWAWDYLRGWKKPQYSGETATKGWELHNAKSLGIVENKWQLESTGDSPAITSPEGMDFEAFQAPFLQLRWTRTGEPKDHARPYVEWLREGDKSFGEDRRVYFYSDQEEAGPVTGTVNSMITMHTHPKWTGKIKRARISLAPGESDARFAIDSFFTVYDTRHTINNPIFIMSCWNQFRWTGDLDFVRANINRMRTALRYQQTAMGGLEHNHIRNAMPGHDGLPGFTINKDGSKTIHGGHGIGADYWDILPIGWDDMYATNQYHAATLVMAEVEEAILANAGWGIPGGTEVLDPKALRKHAAAVKAEANRTFWNAKTGRFVACIDVKGDSHDYGFTFLNLDSIWYGVASDAHAKAILDWLDGKRIVAGDTSTGADIYHWRFGPRATTKRNIDWYPFPWTGPEAIPWGGQVQDGGAVLGFEFYDLWARLKVNGPDDAWKRLGELLKWEKDVYAGGGYREFYKDGKQGTTLQGGGTAGGIGVDCEFFESSLIPSIVTYGFLGLNPGASELAISPRLPRACPEMGMSGILYRGTRLDIKASADSISISIKDQPRDPLRIRFAGKWRTSGRARALPLHELPSPGVYTFERVE